MPIQILVSIDHLNFTKQRQSDPTNSNKKCPFILLKIKLPYLSNNFLFENFSV